MEKEGGNIPLSEGDKPKIRKILSEKKFEDFKIHKHYFREKYTGVFIKIPRHGIELSELKETFKRKHQIKKAFKRKTDRGYLYTLCYEDSEYVFVKIIYIFSEPIQIFSAIKINRKLDKAIEEKYNFSFNL